MPSTSLTTIFRAYCGDKKLNLRHSHSLFPSIKNKIVIKIYLETN